jgi:hypothetical protein
MIPSKIRLGLVLLTLVACKDEAPEPPSVAQAFPTLPLPPQARLISRSGGADALQITMASPARPNDVERYYREFFQREKWKLVSDVRDSDGSRLLLGELEGRPLWVRIRSADDSASTVVELAGAVLGDSARSAKAPS